MNRVARLFASPGLWIPLFVAGPVLWALLPGGMPNTADGLVHFTRSAEMVHAWQDGVYVPRWAENLGLGYGIPLFVYAPPLPYFLTAAAHSLFRLPLDTAYKAMMVTAILIASYGAYRLGATLLGTWAGGVAAAALVYAPIMLRELFIQGNIAQYLAWAFAPWAAWAVIQIYSATNTQRRVGYGLALACAVMGTLLSHNAAALILAGMTAGLAVMLLLFTHSMRGAITTTLGSILGLALSAWFWVPALVEGKYVALDRIVASDFRPRFIALRELVALSPRLDTGSINPYFPLTLGAVQVWLGIAGALLFISLFVFDRLQPDVDANRNRQAERVLRGSGVFFILFAAFCGYMATSWSEPLWTLLPFVDLFEWPFRWHGFTVLGLAWLCAYVVYAAGRAQARAESIAALIALALLLGSSLVNLYPHKLAPGRPYSPAEVVRFESKSNAIGTTSLGEFNPIWVEAPFNTSPLVEDYRAGESIDRLKHQLPAGASGTQTYSSAHRQRFSVNLQEAATLTLNLLYFPGWRAEIDGTPTAISPHPGSGLIDIDVPAGAHTLEVTFDSTPVRRAAGALSILAWIGLAATATVLVRPLRTGPVQTVGSSQIQWPAILGTSIVAGVAIALGATAPGLFRLHSAPDTAYPAEQPLHVDFADQIRLLGIDPTQEVVRPGSTVTLVSYLRALSDMDMDYTAFLHLDDPVSGETVATVDVAHPGGIPTSDWATGLYIRNPLKLRVPEDADPIQYALRLGFYDPQTGDLLPMLENSADVYETGRVWVSNGKRTRPPDGPRVRFESESGDNIELLGAEVQADELQLYWRTDTAVQQDYSVFVHLLDVAGNTLRQLDGAPYDNRYPTSAWRPGQIIVDSRLLSYSEDSGAAIDHIAIGLYNPVSGLRLSTQDSDGAPLSDDALLLSLQERR